LFIYLFNHSKAVCVIELDGPYAQTSRLKPQRQICNTDCSCTETVVLIDTRNSA